jgi:excisionase family DNA binding protein
MSTAAREQVESVAPTFLTPEQVAQLLQVHPRTVLRLAQQDASMPVTRISARVIRFEKAPLLRWLARKRPRLAQAMAQEASSAA